MTSPGYKKEIIDSIYDAVIIVTLTTTYAMILKKGFGMSKPTTKMDFEDIAKLTGLVIAANITKDYAISKKWLPPSILNNK